MSILPPKDRSGWVISVVFYDQKKVIVQFQVAEVVDKKVHAALLGDALTGHEVEVKSSGDEGTAGRFGFVFRTEFFQNPPVAAKLIVGVSDHIVGVRVELVVVGIAAHIRAELFVRPTQKGFAAFKAGFHNQVISRYALTFSQIYRFISICKRLQIFLSDYKYFTTDCSKSNPAPLYRSTTPEKFLLTVAIESHSTSNNHEHCKTDRKRRTRNHYA
jgi:hypothetical protein